MRRIGIVVVAVAMLLGLRGNAKAQYVFIDTNGDGVSSRADVLSPNGVNQVDIWLTTNRDRNGGAAVPRADTTPLGIFSYEFILGAVGGTVSWGDYTNRMSECDVSFGREQDETELYLGFGGRTELAPGKHRLGTLQVTVKSGMPHLEFRATSHVNPDGFTSFGSFNRGKNGDHTIKLARNSADLSNVAAAGDFLDSDGILSAVAAAPQAAASSGSLQFGVSVTSGPSAVLKVTTTRPGGLSVRLFDVQGRVVRTLADRVRATPGVHTFPLASPEGRNARIASGIYFYRVETLEGTRSGRVVMLR